MAKYKVVQEPGVQVPNLGLIRAGEVFEMPDDVVPSRHLIPMDEGARGAIKKAKEEYVAKLEQSMSEQYPPKKLPEAEKRRLLEVPELDSKKAVPPFNPAPAPGASVPAGTAPATGTPATGTPPAEGEGDMTYRQATERHHSKRTADK